MKKFFSFLLLTVFCFTMTSCVMLRAGVNFGSEKSEVDSPGFDSPQIVTTAKSSAIQQTISSTSSETGFYVGLAFTDEFLELSDDFTIQPEINFVGIKDLNQIQAPVLARYNFAEGFNAYAGPNFAYLLDAPDGIKSFNFALDVGISYDISDDFLIEARYDYGLTNLIENGNSNFSSKLRNFQVGVAYRFGE